MSYGVLVAFGIGNNEMDIGVLFFSAAHEEYGDFVGKMALSDAVRTMQQENMGKRLVSKKRL